MQIDEAIRESCDIAFSTVHQSLLLMLHYHELEHDSITDILNVSLHHQEKVDSTGGRQQGEEGGYGIIRRGGEGRGLAQGGELPRRLTRSAAPKNIWNTIWYTCAFSGSNLRTSLMVVICIARASKSCRRSCCTLSCVPDTTTAVGATTN